MTVPLHRRATWISISLAIALGLLGVAIGFAWLEEPASSSPAGPHWLSNAQRQIEALEYHASSGRKGLQAPNRRHGLRTYFERTGIRVVDRTAPGSPQLLSLSLVALGRGEVLTDVAPGQLHHHDSRVEIAHAEMAVVEWFENSTRGLEHGMTLSARPSGEGPLQLEIAVEDATVLHGEDALSFQSDAGRRLRYDKLLVEDARGETIAAHFAPSDRGFRLVVDDEGATYPLLIDPLLTSTFDNEIESNQIGAALGRAVAAAGDVNGDGYDDVIVGAWSYDLGQADEGAVFIFHGGPSGIGDGNPINADTVLQSNQGGSLFGISIDTAGDVNGDGYDDVIVGAYAYETTGGPNSEGAAWIWLGGPGGIADGDPTTAATELHSNQADARFGADVAHAGDVNGDGYGDVLVGAHLYESSPPDADEGAAFLFLGAPGGIPDGDGTSAHSVFQSNQAGAQLGFNVASAGDIDADGYDDIVLGAALYSNTFSQEGLVLVYHGSATGIPPGTPASADASFEGLQASARLGSSVASAGDVNGDGYGDVVIGSYLYNLGEVDEGVAFVHHGSATGLGFVPASVIESDQTSAFMGWSVDSAGDINGDGYGDIVVSAHVYDAGETDEGVALVLLGSASGIPSGGPEVAYGQLESNQAGARLGVQVAGAGDVNGDGYGDLIVGADAMDGPQFDEGQAFVYHGGATGIADSDLSDFPARFESNQVGANLGYSVASAGDVNGDGYADVIVGAPYYDAGETNEGAAFVFLGSAAGFANGSPSTVDAVIESDQTDAFLGFSVASAGDVNGDGYADVIVGAYLYDAGESNEGAAFVFLGSASGIADGDPATAHAQLESDQTTPIWAGASLRPGT